MAHHRSKSQQAAKSPEGSFKNAFLRNATVVRRVHSCRGLVFLGKCSVAHQTLNQRVDTACRMSWSTAEPSLKMEHGGMEPANNSNLESRTPLDVGRVIFPASKRKRWMTSQISRAATLLGQRNARTGGFGMWLMCAGFSPRDPLGPGTRDFLRKPTFKVYLANSAPFEYRSKLLFESPPPAHG